MDQKLDTLCLASCAAIKAIVSLVKREPQRSERAGSSGGLKVDEEPCRSLTLLDRASAWTQQLVMKQYPSELEMFRTFKSFKGEATKEEMKTWWEFNRKKLWKQYYFSSIL